MSKSGVLLAILLFGMEVKADKNDHPAFLFSCEFYQEGEKHFIGTKYLHLTFRVIPAKTWGKRLFTAHLQKAVVSDTHHAQFKRIGYYESGDPSYSASPGYLEGVAKFLERNPVRFSFRQDQLYLENGDSLKKAFDHEMISQYPVYVKNIPLEYRDYFFEMDHFLKLFQNIRIKLPDDLKAPGDLALKDGIVYNYLDDYKHLHHLEITNIKNHTKSVVYLEPVSGRAIYRKDQALRVQTIVKITESVEKQTTRLEGLMPGVKNKEIRFDVNGLSPLDTDQKMQIKTDASGRFSLALSQNFPVMITSSTGHRFYAEPGDDYSVKANLKGDSLFFEGIGVGNNRFIQEEARLEKFPELKNRRRRQETQTSWFRKADQTTNACFDLLFNYRSDLTPCFYESQYLTYYYGKINRKLDYLFAKVDIGERGILRRAYTGLDTIPTQYQSFIFNREFNRFLEKNFLLQFEKLRNFTYAVNYQTDEIPTAMELVRLATLSSSGKILRDYMEYVAPRIYQSANSDDKKAFENLVQEYFDNTDFQAKLSKLQGKTGLPETGSLFPDIRFKDTEGSDISLARYKGKIVYLMFWRNDALAMDKQWAEYQQLTERLSAESVLFVNIGMEEDFGKWKAYLESMKIKGQNLFIDRNSEAFRTNLSRVRSRHFMLIDKTGTVVNNNGPDPSVANILIAQNIGSSGNEKFLRSVLILCVAILIIAGMVWLISRVRHQRKEKIEALLNRLRETELKAIKAQMNPHFLFNSLNSIQNLINQQKIEAANMYLSKFARLLHSVLQHSEKEFIPLAQELETLDLYVGLEQLRFNFDYQLKVSPGIDIHNSSIPPLLMQPFIENAIFHGLQPKQGEKKLDIHIEERDKQLICKIEDNGIGRNLSQSGNTGHHGIGNKLSMERIHLLNQKNSSNFKLSIEDLTSGSGGTRVIISFNNNLI